MKPFEKLSVQENKSLLNYPIYMSLLAANDDGKLDDAERSSAISFAHTKTFSCHPLLTLFFEQVDKVFEKNLIQLNIELPKEKASRRIAIKKELSGLDKMVFKLGKKYASILHRSMESFKNHVSNAHHNVSVDFIFPIPMPGLTEK